MPRWNLVLILQPQAAALVILSCKDSQSRRTSACVQAADRHRFTSVLCKLLDLQSEALKEQIGFGAILLAEPSVLSAIDDIENNKT